MLRTVFPFCILPVIGFMVFSSFDDPSAVAASADLVPGSMTTYATTKCIGIEWDITGDPNHTAVCTVRYRPEGSSIYEDSTRLYRVDFQGDNMLAGSILFLEPGTNYALELTMSDPDGGQWIEQAQVATLEVPSMPTGGQVHHVIPGNGGGTGSSGDPFLGVEAAEANVQPGDICLLHGGNYGGTIFFNSGGLINSPIVWKAAGDGDPIFEGIRVEADYLWFEGLKIINQMYGMRTSPPGPKGIVVSRCFFDNNHYGIFLNDGGEGWYIADNTIIGDNIPNTSNFSGEGIELQHTDGHTVVHNTISRVADGISYPGRNVDIYGNDILDTSDDGIEFDYGRANNRAWSNRITNLYNNGISFQPMDGAPYYVLYNQVAVLNNQSVLKLRTRSDRALIAHNTFIINSGPMASGSQFLNNFEIKNNLWISINDRYAWENGVTTTTNWKTDFDHNGFDWGNYEYAFKWSDVRLRDIPAFHAQTGQETNGIRIDHTTCFENLHYTTTNGMVDSFHLEYHTLSAACPAIDHGIVIMGINEDFNGLAPDLGAYEYGRPLPVYGVRQTCETPSVNQWVGPMSGDWHASPAYWSLGRIPTVCDHVLIDGGKQVTINAGLGAMGYSLEIGSGAMLETEAGATLTIVSTYATHTY